ncbi:MAG: LysR family transcriptional regulator [Rhodospirillales bacterium]|nr:MAG: LysR family transcriptional regulator [Rhodospirillales bacterium]
MGIEPRYLRTVIAAAEHGSLRRAAAALGTKQSTLSRHIRQLEKQLGVQLFERSSGGVRATVTGSEIVRRSRRLLEQMDRMASVAQSTGRGEAGGITIGTCTPLSANRFRALLAEYLRAFPDVEFQVVEHARARLLAGLAMGDIDIVVVAGESKAHDGPSMFLWSERIFVALPAGHRLTGNETIYWPDLKGEAFLLSRRDPGLDLHGVIVQKLAAPGEAVDVTCWSVAHDSILAMLEVLQKVSIQCESWTGFACPGVIFRAVRDAAGPSYIAFTACWEHENSNPALARFLEMLRKDHPQTVGN